MQSTNKRKQTIRVLSLAWLYMTAFLLPYIQYTFYEPLRTGLGASHEQLGSLISMYAILCLFAYIPGGWVADRFSLKKILMLSMALNVVLCVLITVSFTWSTALWVWALCALTSGAACWAALIKGVGQSGTSDEQGRVWGLYEFGDAFLGLIISYVNLGIFSFFEQSLGLKAVFLNIAVLSIIAIILIGLFFEDSKAVAAEGEAPQKGGQLADILRVFTMPIIWVVALIIMCNYLVYAGMTYFTPYLTDVLGFGIVAGTTLVILRSNGLRMAAGPTFGKIADQKSSPLRAMEIGMALTALLILIFIGCTHTNSVVLIIVIFFAATFTLLGSRGIAFATLDEAKIPNNVRGLAVALVSMIAYTPDLVIYKLYGGLLDQYGNDGYTYIFYVLAGLSAITFILCGVARRMNAKTTV